MWKNAAKQNSCQILSSCAVSFRFTCHKRTDLLLSLHVGILWQFQSDVYQMLTVTYVAGFVLQHSSFIHPMFNKFRASLVYSKHLKIEICMVNLATKVLVYVRMYNLFAVWSQNTMYMYTVFSRATSRCKRWSTVGLLAFNAVACPGEYGNAAQKSKEIIKAFLDMELTLSPEEVLPVKPNTFRALILAFTGAACSGVYGNREFTRMKNGVSWYLCNMCLNCNLPYSLL